MTDPTPAEQLAVEVLRGHRYGIIAPDGSTVVKWTPPTHPPAAARPPTTAAVAAVGCVLDSYGVNFDAVPGWDHLVTDLLAAAATPDSPVVDSAPARPDTGTTGRPLPPKPAQDAPVHLLAPRSEGRGLRGAVCGLRGMDIAVTDCFDDVTCFGCLTWRPDVIRMAVAQAAQEAMDALEDSHPLLRDLLEDLPLHQATPDAATTPPPPTRQGCPVCDCNPGRPICDCNPGPDAADTATPATPATTTQKGDPPAPCEADAPSAGVRARTVVVDEGGVSVGGVLVCPARMLLGSGAGVRVGEAWAVLDVRAAGVLGVAAELRRLGWRVSLG